MPRRLDPEWMTTVSNVTDRFLLEERTHSGSRIDPVDRARFHRIVRLCSELWGRHALTALRVSRGKQGVSLLFDGPIGGRNIALFSLRVDYKRGEYRFCGPNADRKRMGLGDDELDALERLRDLYAAMLVEGPTADVSVTRTLRGKPFPDLLPLVEETRRILDGGQDGSSSAPARARNRKSKPAPTTPVGHSPAPNSASNSQTASATEAIVTDIILTCPEPKDSAAFFRRLFGVKSEAKTEPADHAVYAMGGVRVILRADLSAEDRRKLGYTSLKRHRGWGMTLAIKVPDWEACLRRVKRIPNALVSEDSKTQTMLIQDPAGYLLEVGSSAAH